MDQYSNDNGEACNRSAVLEYAGGECVEGTNKYEDKEPEIVV